MRRFLPVLGWLLGGTAGAGTVVYAFGIGGLVQLILRITPQRVLAHSGWASVTDARRRRASCTVAESSDLDAPGSGERLEEPSGRPAGLRPERGREEGAVAKGSRNNTAAVHPWHSSG